MTGAKPKIVRYDDQERRNAAVLAQHTYMQRDQFDVDRNDQQIAYLRPPECPESELFDVNTTAILMRAYAAIYQPPRVRLRIDRDLSEGRSVRRIPVLSDDLNDSEGITPADFVYICENEPSPAFNALKNANISKNVCCSCVGECEVKTCECIQFVTANACLLRVQKGCHMFKPKTGKFYDFWNKLGFGCGAECSCNENCANRIQKDLGVKLEVFKRIESKIGFGLRTLSPLDEGQILTEFAGKLVTNDELYKSGRVEAAYSLLLYGSDEKPIKRKKAAVEGTSLHELLRIHNVNLPSVNLSINPYRRGNEARFVSHGCFPNLEIVRYAENSLEPKKFRIFLVARHSVAAGAELTFDYGERYKLDKTCLCKTLFCNISSVHGLMFKAMPEDQRNFELSRLELLLKDQKRRYKARLRHPDSTLYDYKDILYASSTVPGNYKNPPKNIRAVKPTSKEKVQVSTYYLLPSTEDADAEDISNEVVVHRNPPMPFWKQIQEIPPFAHKVQTEVASHSDLSDDDENQPPSVRRNTAPPTATRYQDGAKSRPRRSVRLSIGDKDADIIELSSADEMGGDINVKKRPILSLVMKREPFTSESDNVPSTPRMTLLRTSLAPNSQTSDTPDDSIAPMMNLRRKTVAPSSQPSDDGPLASENEENVSPMPKITRCCRIFIPRTRTTPMMTRLRKSMLPISQPSDALTDSVVPRMSRRHRTVPPSSQPANDHTHSRATTAASLENTDKSTATDVCSDSPEGDIGGLTLFGKRRRSTLNEAKKHCLR